MNKKAVILLSGGLDSATTLAMAMQQGLECYTLNIRYDQRNRSEIQASEKISATLGAIEHRTVFLEIGHWGGSALTDHSLNIPDTPSNDIPITYVPARNSIFLSTALAWAEVLQARDIFYGANIVDYSNYPDCRPEFIRAFENMANLATRAGVEGDSFRVHAPLLELNKAEIIRIGHELGVDYAMTISCYDAGESGLACGVCDPCRFRAKGFVDAGLADVTQYRSI